MRGKQRSAFRGDGFLRQFLAIRFPLGAGSTGGGQFGHGLFLAAGFGTGQLLGFKTGPQGGFGSLLGTRLLDGQSPGLRLDADALARLFLGHHFGLRPLFGGVQQHGELIGPQLGFAARPLVAAGLCQCFGLCGAVVVERGR